jgi:hypothetical protein
MHISVVILYVDTMPHNKMDQCAVLRIRAGAETGLT